MADEILNFGVPLEFDTGDNESHHIPAKVAAWLTQKIKENFEESTSKRLIEKEVLDLARMEMNGKFLWEHRNGPQVGHESEVIVPDAGDIVVTNRTIRLGGVAFRTRTDPFSGTHWLRPVKKLKAGKALPRVEQDLIDFVAGLEAEVSGFLDHPVGVLFYCRNLNRRKNRRSFPTPTISKSSHNYDRRIGTLMIIT